MSVAPEVVHRSEARALARVPEDKDGQGGTYTARSVLVRSPGTSSVLRSTQSSPHAASRVYCRLSAEPAGSFMYAAALARPNRRSLAGEGTIGTACLACVHRPDGGGGGGDAVGRSSLLMPTATWRVASRTKERRTNEGERLRWYAAHRLVSSPFLQPPQPCMRACSVVSLTRHSVHTNRNDEDNNEDDNNTVNGNGERQQPQPQQRFPRCQIMQEAPGVWPSERETSRSVRLLLPPTQPPARFEVERGDWGLLSV
ncbi:MAG: hypothetical protein FE78DRAFT_70809 [Acidomyces sp. 'richmondensis']|nr:MAG: hypothetical protein FE78DRAFT_70809 [Acidomyces sp. 'richmondensis']